MSRNATKLTSVFLLAMSVLMMEVCLTRIFSVLSWHHFAYLIISLALLGFGAAGSYLTVSRRFAAAKDDARLLGHFAWLFAVAAALAVILVTKIRFYPVDIAERGDYSNGLSLLILYGIVGVPFFFAGVCLGRLIALAGNRVNQFYFADLIGAGLGALLALVVLNHVGAIAGVFLSALLGSVAACLLGYGSRGWRRWVYPITPVVLAGLIALTATSNALPLYYPPSKELFRGENRVEYSRWHVLGKIDVTRAARNYWTFGGALSRRFTDPPPPVHGIYQDGAAPTGILVLEPDVTRAEDVRILGEYLQGVAYTVRPVGSSLIIGVGGGIDALIALHHGAQRVVGVDINPVTVDAVRGRYRDRCPLLWRTGAFEMEVAEGRHYLTRTKQKFDVIQLSGVDTYTALSSGAYALSENFLYTREAMGDYWRHLADEGILSFSRWLIDPPRETLRLVTTQLAMLEDTGAPEPWKHLVILAAPAYYKRSPWAETLLQKTPFTTEQADRLRAWAADRRFDVLYDPYQRRDNAFDRFIRAAPARRRRLIEDCRFNVRPTTDDDPFFFQFYRWQSLLELAGGRGGLVGSKGGYGITRVPLGLLVLAMSLGQILVLSLVFILLPLWLRRRRRARQPGRLGAFVYFAALGLGFMFIEIALLQKFSVFVGGPVYSMAITLACILVFSGLGSLIAQAFRRHPGRYLAAVIPALAVLTVAEIAFLNTVLPNLFGLSLHARWLVTALALFPIGLLMGMPFPTGLRIVERMAPDLRPWVWGINACLTVLASMLCVLVSIHAGFTVSLGTAAVIYILGGIGLWLAARQQTKTAAAAA